jgi:hypothetical protein
MCQFLVVGEVEGDRELGWLDYVFSLVHGSKHGQCTQKNAPIY